MKKKTGLNHIITVPGVSGLYKNYELMIREITYYLRDLDKFGESNGICSFVKGVIGALNSSEQTQIIQSKKKLVKCAMEAQLNHSRSAWLKSTQLLISLYISPYCNHLRIHGDWIISIFLDVYSQYEFRSDCSMLLNAVAETCQMTLDSCKVSWHRQDNDNLSEECSLWLPCLYSMVLLHKDVLPWMQPQGDDTSPDTILFGFLSVLSPILKFCVERLIASDENNVISPADLCSDCMRILVASLKSWFSRYNRPEEVHRWAVLIDNMMADIASALCSDAVSKDAVTNLALGAMALQKLVGSFCGRGDGRCRQVAAIVQLLPHRGALPRELVGEGITAGVHPEVVSLLPTLSTVAKTAILRACLALCQCVELTWESPLVDEEGVLVQTAHPLIARDGKSILPWLLGVASEPVEAAVIVPSKDHGRSRPARPGQTWILLGPAMAFLMSVSHDPSPTTQLYALQTVEIWLARIADCVVEVGRTELDGAGAVEGGVGDAPPRVENVLRIFDGVAAMLTVFWGHPARQARYPSTVSVSLSLSVSMHR